MCLLEVCAFFVVIIVWTKKTESVEKTRKKDKRPKKETKKPPLFADA
jgi:hypothetical protein